MTAATSRAALERTKRVPDARRVLTLLLEHEASGATQYEARIALGMPHQTCSARFNDLKNAGVIEETGQTRPTDTSCEADVYRIKHGLSDEDAWNRFQAWAKSDREAKKSSKRDKQTLIDVAAQTWVNAAGTSAERVALQTLLQTIWAAYGKGEMPDAPDDLKAVDDEPICNGCGAPGPTHIRMSDEGLERLCDDCS